MFVIKDYSTKSKYYDDSNKLVVDKMRDATASVAIKEFLKLKPRVYSFLENDSSEHKKERL